MNSESFRALLDKAGCKPGKTSQKGWTSANCPAHEDRNASFGFSVGSSGALVIKCQAGCSSQEIVAALGIGLKDLFAEDSAKPDAKVQLVEVAHYVYTDTDGKPDSEAVRFKPKTFRQRLPGAKTYGLGGHVCVYPYHVQRLRAEAARSGSAWVVEGEKDVETAEKAGFVATCNLGGAGKWRDELSAQFVGLSRVAIVADRDPLWKWHYRKALGVGEWKRFAVGQDHAVAVGRSLVANGVKSVQIVEMPDHGGHEIKDLADALAAGLDKPRLDAHVAGHGRSVEDYAAALGARIEAENPARKVAERSAAGVCVARPVFDIPLNLEDATGALLASLAETNDPPTVFVHTDAICELAKRDDGGAALRRVANAASGRELIGRRFNFRVYSKDGMKALAHAPKALVENVLARPGHMVPLPRVATIIRAPAFGKSGNLLSKDGYYASDEALVDLGGFKCPDVPKRPTEAEIHAARDMLFDLVCDVPFETDGGRTAWLAALLSFPARLLFGGTAPMLAVEATTPGTGKGLLVELLRIIAIGPKQRWDPLHIGRNEEENQKALIAVLDAGPTGVVIDNLKDGGLVDSPRLASVLTSSTYGGRVLGTSNNVNLPNTAFWMATGNNLRWSSELTARILPVRLIATCERPRERGGFKHSLPHWAAENRAPLVAGMLTLVRAWIVAGMPAGKAVMGSFEDWAQKMSGILECAGVDSLLANRDDLFNRADDEGNTWRPFVLEWFATFGCKTVSISELVRLADDKDLLGDLIKSDSSKGATTKLGSKLKGIEGRIFHKWRIGSVVQTTDRRNGRKLIDVTDETLDNVKSFCGVSSYQNQENLGIQGSPSQVGSVGGFGEPENLENLVKAVTTLQMPSVNVGTGIATHAHTHERVALVGGLQGSQGSLPVDIVMYNSGEPSPQGSRVSGRKETDRAAELDAEQAQQDAARAVPPAASAHAPSLFPTDEIEDYDDYLDGR